MAFFEDQDVRRLINKHIDDISKLEDKEAEKLIRKYKQIRTELRDRLDLIPGQSFTAQRLRGVIVQIDTALREFGHLLTTDMAEAGNKASRKSIEDMTSEINKFNKEFTGAVIPIDVDKVVVAQDVGLFLFEKYQSSIQSYSFDLRQTIVSGLTQAAIEEVSYSEIIRRINQFFMQEEWKIHRIVRTELHNIYNIAKQKGMEETKEKYIPDLQKTLFHPMDDRTGEDSKQAAEKNLVVDIDKPFSYTYVRYKKDGTRVEEKRVFMAPPDRPNDRSILVPYRKEWED